MAPASLRVVPPPRRTDSFVGDDALVVAAARAGDDRARGAIYDRHARHVHRVLYRILGFRTDLADLHHDVFVQALASLDKLESPGALKAWLTQIAVHLARRSIARRRRWLWFLPGDELPDVDAGAASGEIRDALRATYTVLGSLPADEQVAFALRFIDGMELAEVAAASGASIATVKRRLARAAVRFERGARRQPALETWLKGGGRWADRSTR